MSDVIKQPDPSTPPGWYLNPQGASQWWDGRNWVIQPQIIAVQRGTNHTFHLIMSLITLGFWIPVWIVVAIVNSTKRP